MANTQTAADKLAELQARAVYQAKGNRFEDMTQGRIFEHHWGRTLTAGDNAAFSTMTMSFCPLYFNTPYALSLGYTAQPVNPLLVFNTIFGLTVEDLSEGGGPFLGVDDCHYRAPVYVGDTLTARSAVISARESRGNVGFGIVTWHTQGFNQDGMLVIEYQRTNLVRRRTPRNAGADRSES